MIASLRAHRRGLVLTGSCVAPVALAAVLVPFRTEFASPAAALVLVVVIVAFAVVGGRSAGILATISATLSFDYFLTVPYERLAITHRSDLESAICLLLVGLAVTELAAYGSRHRARAREGVEFVDGIYTVAELAAAGTSRDRVASTACEEIAGVLQLRACRFEPGAARGDVARLNHDGSVSIGPTVWGVETLGLPGQRVELEVLSGGAPVGHFVLSPTPGLTVSLERRLVAVSIADQVGAAVGARSD